MVKNSLQGTGVRSLWGTRIPHASEQLSTHNTNTELSPSRVQSTTRLNCGVGEDFESPLDCKEIKPVNPKGNQP